MSFIGPNNVPNVYWETKIHMWWEDYWIYMCQGNHTLNKNKFFFFFDVVIFIYIFITKSWNVVIIIVMLLLSHISDHIIHLFFISSFIFQTFLLTTIYKKTKIKTSSFPYYGYTFSKLFFSSLSLYLPPLVSTSLHFLHHFS